MTIQRWMGVVSAVGVLLITGSAGAAAQERTLRFCQQIGDATQRLACFDGLAAGEKKATTERQVKQFGLNERSKEPEDRKEVGQVTAAIVSIQGSQVQLDNDMVWRVVDNADLVGWIRPGQKAMVKPGLLSGYRMQVDGVRGIMVVTRVR
jgi:hypothetical protein